MPVDNRVSALAAFLRQRLHSTAAGLSQVRDPSQTFTEILSLTSSAEAELRRLEAILECLEASERLRTLPVPLPLGPCSLIDALGRIQGRLEELAGGKAPGVQIDYCSPIPERIQGHSELLEDLVARLARFAQARPAGGGVRLLVHRFEIPEVSATLCFEVLVSLPASFRLAEGGVALELIDGVAPPPLALDETQLQLGVLRDTARALGGDLCVQRDNEGAAGMLVSIPASLQKGERLLGLERACLLVDEPEGDPAPAAVRQGRVLVVCDVPDQAQLLAIHLRSAGLDPEVLDPEQDGAPLAGQAAAPALAIVAMLDRGAEAATALERLRRSRYAGPCLVLEPRRGLSRGPGAQATWPVETMVVPVRKSELLARVVELLGAGRSGVAPEELHSDLESDPEMAPIVEELMEWLPNRVQALRESWGVSDPVAVRQIAHELKGTAGACGFKPIALAAASVEGPLRTGAALATLAGAVAELGALCERALSCHRNRGRAGAVCPA